MRRLGVGLGLAGRFVGLVVISGFATAWIIVRPGRQPQPGLVRVPFEDLDETGVAVLGCLVTLTPGSTALDVDLKGKVLLLHLLDASRPEIASTIHHRLEEPLRRLFSKREGP